MRILPPVEEEIRRVVRDARAKDPLISVARLKIVLEEHFERGFSYQYVSKIADKVAREALIVADRTKIEEGMNFTRENYRIMAAGIYGPLRRNSLRTMKIPKKHKIGAPLRD